jgi:RNA polymerase sigma-70 factor (ECF subfamily)
MRLATSYGSGVAGTQSRLLQRDPMGDELEHNPRVSRSALAEHHDGAFAWALALARYDRALAADVLQHAYLLILEGRATFDGRSSLKTWLFGVVRHTALRHWRLRRRDIALASRLAVEPREAAAPHVSIGDGRLAKALAALPQRQRDVLQLVVYADLTLEETAGVLGITVGSVRTHYHRAKGALKESLERESD